MEIIQSVLILAAFISGYIIAERRLIKVIRAMAVENFNLKYSSKITTTELPINSRN